MLATAVILSAITWAMPPASQAAPRPEAISLIGRALFAMPEGPGRAALETDLSAARRALQEKPDDPERIVWVGRRLGYLWRMNEAIEVFSGGIRRFPEYAPLYRHRGHRYISLRRFDAAIADLEKAAKLIGGRPDAIEPDGQPNARNVPLTTLGFNVWYHLGLARYLKGDIDGAARAYETTLQHLGGHDDNLVAVTDWLYMALRRLDRKADAVKLLEPITLNMSIIENAAYHRRLLLYKGLVKPGELLGREASSDLDSATLGYGLGNWYLCNGDKANAMEAFERVVAGSSWPSFGFIAAEAELARLRR